MISIFRGSRESEPAAVDGAAPSKAGRPVHGGSARALVQLSSALKDHIIRSRELNHAEVIARLDEMVQLAERTKEEAPMLEATARACGSVEQYFDQLGKSIESVGVDLSTSIRALAMVIHGCSEQQEKFLTKMDGVRDKLQAGHSLDDIHKMRQHLDSCLTSLKTELLQARMAHLDQKSAILERVTMLHRCVSSLRANVPQKMDQGPALSILRVRRIGAVKDRYGAEVASKLMDFVVQILLVRWPAAYDITPYGEECLVVVDSQNLELDFHREVLRKLTSEKLQFTMFVDEREVSLPLALDWTVIRAPNEGDMDEFIRGFLDGMAQKDRQAASLDRALGL